MAKVVAQVLGGDLKQFDDISTVGELKRAMAVTGYSATVNGEPADDGLRLKDWQVVTLSPAVKGGSR